MTISFFFDALRRTIGVKGTVLKWMKSYLSDRYQSVSIGGVCTSHHQLEYSVPKDSVFFLLQCMPLKSPNQDLSWPFPPCAYYGLLESLTFSNYQGWSVHVFRLKTALLIQLLPLLWEQKTMIETLLGPQLLSQMKFFWWCLGLISMFLFWYFCSKPISILLLMNI